MLHEREKVRIIEKGWGNELIIVNNKLYCGKIITVENKWSSEGRYHKHKIKDETFYHLSGPPLEIEVIQTKRGKIEGTINFWLQDDETYRIAPGTYHRFRSSKLGQSSFIEISSHDDPQDNYYAEIIRAGDPDKPAMYLQEV